MGVYIKGMEMPNSCLFCPLNSMKQCRITGGDITWATATQNRRQDCPLVPVPPHGRLIDADEIKTAFPCGESVRTECVRATIEHAPTIIPASEEVYDKYTDTAGNLHWTGTQSGEHIIRQQEGE